MGWFDFSYLNILSQKILQTNYFSKETWTTKKVEINECLSKANFPLFPLQWNKIKTKLIKGYKNQEWKTSPEKRSKDFAADS